VIVVSHGEPAQDESRPLLKRAIGACEAEQ
jgi:hypothetical protein